MLGAILCVFLFFFFGKLYKFLSYHFHHCYRFSERGGVVNTSNLIYHLLLSGGDFNIISKNTGAGTLVVGAQSCAAPCSLPFSSSFLHSVHFLMNAFVSEVLLILISLTFCIWGYYSEKKMSWCFYEQYVALLEKSGLLYSWREVPYELKSN